MFTTIKKRDGKVVDFKPEKISDAMVRAFRALGIPVTRESITELTISAVDVLQSLVRDGEVPTVEGVQNAVEVSLMRRGHFDVAKSYILYRYEHAKVRQEETVQKIEEHALSVVKRDGRKEPFSREKLTAYLNRFVTGLEGSVDVQAIVMQCQTEVYDGMPTSEISKAVTMVARSMIERDPAYGTLAARMLLDDVYREVLGGGIDYMEIAAQHARQFRLSVERGIALGRLDPVLARFDADELGSVMDISRDHLFDYLGLQTIVDRYLLRDDDTQRLLETPQMFWMRVAMGTALNEPMQSREQWVREFYRIMSTFLYTPSTPTLFHAGTLRPQLSSCYLNTVPDSLDAIFKSYGDNAQLSKWSGGIGTDWTPLRGTGAYIKGTGVQSQGVIPFLKIANDVTVAINRSGRRRGAACVYLEAWHYDLPDFLELRKNTGDERRRTHDMDTANWIPDLFMQRVRDNGTWTLFSPDEVPGLHDMYGAAFRRAYEAYEAKADRGEIKLFRRVLAADIWKKMLAMLFETGHPWITWKDPSNIRSPQDHAGVVHNSNLCTEITLNTSEDETAVCNLGSLNFAKFIVNGVFDASLVGDVVSIAMRMLDNVIDINFYPTEDAQRSNMRHRPVGLGIRGLQDALYLMGINFDSPEAVEFSDRSMEVVSYHAILASSELARERGTYRTYRGSKWDRGLFPQDTIDLLAAERGEEIPLPRGGQLDWTPVREHVRLYGMRNSNTLAIAPTATTANIVGCIPTTEPIYKNLYVKSNQAGDFVVINKYLVTDLKAEGLWGGEMLKQLKYFDGSIQQIADIPGHIKARYKEVFEIESKWLIEAAARRAKWIDQSQSLNIYYRGSSGRDVSDIYFHAWRLGLKTTYYLRTLAASQVEKSTVSTAEFGSTHNRTAAAPMPVAEPAAAAAPMPIPVVAAAPAAAPVAIRVAPAPDAATLARVLAGEEVGICESCEG
jgi:ribonucleoside-diphosphate reductase alpha chain